MNRTIELVQEQEISQEDWKARAERLEECVRVLLAKNQVLRMKLSFNRESVENANRGLAVTARR